MTTSSTVEYRVIVLPARHELQVEITLSGPVAMGSIHLQIPTWVPGDYSFAPQARDLFNVLARCAITNKALPIRRDGWQSYVVVDGAGKVQVSYTASAWGDDLSESAGLIDDHFAVVLGTRYLFAPAHLGACRVDYQLPAGWNIHHPSGAHRIGKEIGRAHV